MKLVTFIKHSLPYNGGESATFEDEVADKMIAEGIAVASDADATLAQLEAELKTELHPPAGAPVDPDVETLTEEQIRAELGGKKKADLVALAKATYGLELSEDSKKDELVEAILAAIVKGAK